MFFTRLQKPVIEIKDLFAAGSLLFRCCFSSPEESSLAFLIIKMDMKIYPSHPPSQTPVCLHIISRHH